MRMNPQSELTADQVVNQFDERELADLIYEFGEERRSRRIARAIVGSRALRLRPGQCFYRKAFWKGRSEMKKMFSLFVFILATFALSAAASAQTATCTAGVTHCANLSWTPASTGATATGFNIYRSLVSGGCAIVSSSTCTKVGSVATASFTDGPLSASTKYFWVVTATNAAGESGPSNEASATTLPDPPPSAPTGLTVVTK